MTSARGTSRRIAVMLAATAFFFTACSTMTERQKEERDYRRAEFEAAYLKYEAWCHKMGRQVVIQAGLGPDRKGIPSPGDYYTCT